MIDCLKVLFLRPGTAEFSAVGRADKEIGKKNIKNLKNIRMFIICPSVLRPDLASKKKRWQDPTKHKNIKT
jgi:hypothetical protein